MNWVECLALFATAALVTIVATPLVRRLAIRLKAIDYPAERRVNKQPIPRMGGLAMLCGMAAAVGVLLVGGKALGWHNPFADMFFPTMTDVDYTWVAVGVGIIFAVGFVDDIKNLPPKVKFVGQLVAACFVAASGLLLGFMQNPFGGGIIQFGWFAYPLTVLYLVAFANVINLIDGLDGLAAGIVAISASSIFALSVLTGRFGAAMLATILIGTCVGFLRWNFHPAKIFMGDSGSLLLGFCLGIISLVAVARSGALVSLLVPLVAAGVPIIDTAAAIVRRVRAHRPIDEADWGHIHHRLLDEGFSQRSIVLTMWLWTAALSVCAVLMVELSGTARTAVVAVVVALTVFGIAKLHLLHPVLMHHYSHRPKVPDDPQE